MRGLAAGAIVIAMAIAGCGGDDGGAGDGGASDITKAEFVQQANAICTEGNQEVSAIFEDVDADTSPEEIGELVESELVPNIRGQVEDIRALGFPEADADELDAMLSETEAVLDDIEGDPVAFAEQTEDPFADVDPKLRAYGLDACGS